jgi:hypothetical protein
MIEPCHFPNEIHPDPLEPVNLACTTAGRQCELHDRLHVRRQSRDQSVSLHSGEVSGAALKRPAGEHGPPSVQLSRKTASMLLPSGSSTKAL